ncbi:MAG: hypothetical protein JXA50_00790 [Deltaproteobacteria bacterium]|nr:hypothetical protein [Deltaproteobacteria bacterium]
MTVVNPISEAKPISIKEILSRNLQDILFPAQLKLVPQVNEVYELALAFFESQVLSDEEIQRNGAYFAEVNGQPTRHFLMCQGAPLRLAEHSSSRLKSFFKINQFKTGYDTNGLFPYRGKFHPQMIKALINVMGLKPGDTVLDPMMGSGTVLIEATLMGINSIGFDASPFCEFMTRAKIHGLRVPLKAIKAALDNFDSTFEYFCSTIGATETSVSTAKKKLLKKKKISATGKELLPYGFKKESVQNYLLLAFLDAKGYSERSQRKSFKEQFKAILERYYFVAEKIQTVLDGFQEELGEAKPRLGDARKMPLDDRSIDGIIFSPPYSFAIDYLENDAYHLKALGVDIDKLSNGMVGLRGRTQTAKYENYIQDMTRIISECSRVLKPGKLCSIVVGTNNNQLSNILKVRPEEVKGIDEQLIEIAQNHGLNLIRKIERQITGMANTMRLEFIVMLQKNPLT